MKKTYLITSAWPYVNGVPHIGHIAGAYLPADIYKRYCNLKGRDSIYVSGSDMHGVPTITTAESMGKKPTEVAYHFDNVWRRVLSKFEINFDLYSTTEEENHKKMVQDIFLSLLSKGYISLGKESQPYCKNEKRFIPDRYVIGKCHRCGKENVKVGESCEECNKLNSFEDVIDPKCKICKSTPVLKETDNFFLELPKLESEIKKYLKTRKNSFRKDVYDLSIGFIKEGLKRRSITRDIEYGIPVPVKGYEHKVIYVWFEALIGYLSASEKLTTDWTKYWNSNSNICMFLGKDNIIFHTIIFPAILIAYNKNIHLPTNIIGNEYVLLEGRKMSKSDNHLLEAEYLIDNFGSDASRFYITYSMPENKDFNFTWKEFGQTYNSSLSSNIGNYIHRTLTFLQNNFNGEIGEGKIDKEDIEDIKQAFKNVEEYLDHFEYQNTIKEILKLSDKANQRFNILKIWESKDKDSMYTLMQYVYALCILLKPITPKAIEKLEEILHREVIEYKYTPYTGKIGAPQILFPKIEDVRIQEETDKVK
jgi:methionyl-tRNA synthetase